LFELLAYIFIFVITCYVGLMSMSIKMLLACIMMMKMWTMYDHN